MTDGVEAAIVAFYGAATHRGLDDHIGRLQHDMASRLGSVFVPRRLSQVHSTVIGLDSLGPWSDRDDLIGSAAVGRAVAAVKVWDGWPLTVQIGGFEDADLALRSRGQRLFARSLAINAGQVVLLGWPVSTSGEPLDALRDLRGQMSQWGVVHRYGPDDPDAHLVIGQLAHLLEEAEEEDFLAWGRERLRRDVCRVEMSPSDLSVVAYTDTDLPPESTAEHSFGPASGLGSGREGRP